MFTIKVLVNGFGIISRKAGVRSTKNHSTTIAVDCYVTFSPNIHCLLWLCPLMAYVVNNMDPDQTAPLGVQHQ